MDLIEEFKKVYFKEGRNYLGVELIDKRMRYGGAEYLVN